MQFHPLTCQKPISASYIIHERDLGESQICFVYRTQCRQQSQLKHPFHVYAVEKANATLIFLGPQKTFHALWDPSLNTHLLFRINIKKKKKKKKKKEHTHRSSARFVWNLWPQSKCKSHDTTQQLHCGAAISSTFCRKSPQHHQISN